MLRESRTLLRQCSWCGWGFSRRSHGVRKRGTASKNLALVDFSIVLTDNVNRRQPRSMGRQRRSTAVDGISLNATEI